MIKKTYYGYQIRGETFYLHILFYRDHLLRFVYTFDEKLPSSTPAVAASYQNIEACIQGNILEAGRFQIHIDPSLQITIYDLEGNLISQDKKINPFPPSMEKKLLWEKGFYGMGEKYSFLNLMNTDTIHWNTDVMGIATIHHPMIKTYHTAIPFYIGLSSRQCYGIYFDNSYRTYFDFAKKDPEVVSFSGEDGILDYYFIYDSNISGVIEGYSHLTGRMPLPPKAFLGYQQCRWSYENRNEFMEIALKMRTEGVPCDVLYLDIDYMKDYKVFTVDSEKFNEFKEMIALLKKMGFKVVVIIDPGVKVEKGYTVYEEGKKKGYFVKTPDHQCYVGKAWPGKVVFPDFLREEVREWWGNLHKELIEYGIEGFWNDMNEPSDFSTESKTLSEEVIHRTDNGTLKKHCEIHNLYGLLEAQSTYAGWKKQKPNQRPFILTRAAFSGTQRYAALWTGDNASVWEHLEISLPMLLNLGLSGFPFVGADVGGFAGDCSGELLVRWTQVGAFTPLFRNHSCKGTQHQEPWCFGKEKLENVKKYISLRYRLVPYLYTLMWQSTLTGDPVIRPLFYHYQWDENTFHINDQFLFGEKIMVCPVLRPKCPSRMIYFPPGIWYDYWTGEKISGGRYMIRETPLNLLPLYVKSGAILPMTEVSDFIKEMEEKLEIHIYYGSSSSFTLYLDDGITFDYQKGSYSEIELIMKKSNNGLILSSSIHHKGYPIPSFNLCFHGFPRYNNWVLNRKRISLSSGPIPSLEVPSSFYLEIK